ncbi:hypothetical protein PC9H_007660 [Pleurotus ostreatus]|uniref:Palmitoyl-protein thioesterase 1 n=2 Tax=Pleurotus ostreatus TaxID=5322 RepID=A0A8H6ZTZ5_PLEOS|nr:uncharacterized protein PC9H_007660 [Pleurotus ostreatus]KAF7428436.1 hypothetical protein PC9H_007660 [Pleurotus ostreatus]
MLLPLALSFCALAAASPLVQKYRPLVLWHGLGDSHSSPGMLEFASLIGEMYPGIFIHSIYIEQDADADRKATFYGNVNSQVDMVNEQLNDIPELKDGFDAIGFSQGGQFLRAYVERYNDPPLHNLITFGSQHMGVSEVSECRRYDFLCQIARRAVKNGVYSKWAQGNLVQAQYFRDPSNLETFLEANHFLTSINNEVAPIDGRNETYARNLASLEHLVLVLFTKDVTVIPKESAWFGSAAEPDESDDSLTVMQEKILGSTTSGEETTIIPMRRQPLYLEDWIGLRTLDEQGRVILETCEGEHMQIGDCWKPLVKKFVGSPA